MKELILDIQEKEAGTMKIEKLVAVVYRPSLNNWAEFARDITITVFFIGLFIFNLIERLT